MNKNKKAEKELIKVLSKSQRTLRNIENAKTKYVLDLNDGKQTFISQNIYNQELLAQIDFFVTMYGFMDYYYKINPTQPAKLSRDYILCNSCNILNPGSKKLFQNMINLLDVASPEDYQNSIFKAFLEAYQRGYNLSPLCNKSKIELVYVNLYDEYLHHKQYLTRRVEQTGNSKQLTKIANSTRNHLERKNSYN